MKHTRQQALRLAVLACVIGAALLGATGKAQAQTRMRLATLAPKDSSPHNALKVMAEKWRQAPGGGVALTIYTDGTMGSEADMVRRMRVGQIQAAMLTVGGLSEIDPAVNALQKMPLVFRDWEEMDYVRARLEPMLAQRLLEKGFVAIFWGDAGWVRFFSKQPAVRPDELKKMKMFVGAGDEAQVNLMKKVGCQPVPLEWSDALTGLQTGMIDAIPTTPFYALAGQFYGVARHMVDVKWVPLVGATVVTKKVWDALAPETRAALLQAASEAGKTITARSRQEGDEAIEAMKKRGLQVHALTPQAEEEWRRLVEELYPKVRGSMVPAETFDEVRRLVAEYRATRLGGPVQR